MPLDELVSHTRKHRAAVRPVAISDSANATGIRRGIHCTPRIKPARRFAVGVSCTSHLDVRSVLYRTHGQLSTHCGIGQADAFSRGIGCKGRIDKHRPILACLPNTLAISRVFLPCVPMPRPARGVFMEKQSAPFALLHPSTRRTAQGRNGGPCCQTSLDLLGLKSELRSISKAKLVLVMIDSLDRSRTARWQRSPSHHVFSRHTRQRRKPSGTSAKRRFPQSRKRPRPGRRQPEWPHSFSIRLPGLIPFHYR